MKTRPGYILLAVLLLAAGCGGHKLPTKRAMYRIACRAAKERCDLPDSARFRPVRETTFSIAKNAARIDLVYDYKDNAGRPATGRHSIWLKRVARTWTFHRAYPTPQYPPPQSG